MSSFVYRDKATSPWHTKQRNIQNKGTYKQAKDTMMQQEDNTSREFSQSKNISLGQVPHKNILPHLVIENIVWQLRKRIWERIPDVYRMLLPHLRQIYLHNNLINGSLPVSFNIIEVQKNWALHWVSTACVVVITFTSKYPYLRKNVQLDAVLKWANVAYIFRNENRDCFTCNLH